MHKPRSSSSSSGQEEQQPELLSKQQMWNTAGSSNPACNAKPTITEVVSILGRVTSADHDYFPSNAAVTSAAPGQRRGSLRRSRSANNDNNNNNNKTEPPSSSSSTVLHTKKRVRFAMNSNGAVQCHAQEYERGPSLQPLWWTSQEIRNIHVECATLMHEFLHNEAFVLALNLFYNPDTAVAAAAMADPDESSSSSSDDVDDDDDSEHSIMDEARQILLLSAAARGLEGRIYKRTPFYVPQDTVERYQEALWRSQQHQQQQQQQQQQDWLLNNGGVCGYYSSRQQTPPKCNNTFAFAMAELDAERAAVAYVR